MERSNPFTRSFETLDLPLSTNLEAINQGAFMELVQVAHAVRQNQQGQQVVLRSPRAGFGKTHLLSRLRSHLKSWQVFRLSLLGGTDLTPQSATEDMIAQLLEPLPDAGGLTKLDIVARKLFALGLTPIVTSGDVPCEDRDATVEALNEQPIETFNFHSEAAMTALWARENFQVLAPRLAQELASLSGCGQREASFWVTVLFDYAATPPPMEIRNSVLSGTINQAFTDLSETHGGSRVSALVNLLGLVSSCALVVDDTEALASDSESALGVASFLQALRQSCPRVLLILSVNGDVWESAFAPRLSAGLKERLCENVIDLQPLSSDQVSLLIDELGGSHAATIKAELGRLDGILYTRRIFQEAGRIWQREEGPLGDNDTEVSIFESEVAIYNPDLSPAYPDPSVVYPEAAAGSYLFGGAAESTDTEAVGSGAEEGDSENGDDEASSISKWPAVSASETPADDQEAEAQESTAEEEETKVNLKDNKSLRFKPLNVTAQVRLPPRKSAVKQQPAPAQPMAPPTAMTTLVSEKWTASNAAAQPAPTAYAVTGPPVPPSQAAAPVVHDTPVAYGQPTAAVYLPPSLQKTAPVRVRATPPPNPDGVFVYGAPAMAPQPAVPPPSAPVFPPSAEPVGAAVAVEPEGNQDTVDELLKEFRQKNSSDS